MNQDISAQLRGLVALARAGGNSNEVVALGSVTALQSAQAKLKAGIDIEGFVHSVDVYAIRHTFKKHGDERVEKSRGQLAITEADIADLQTLIAAPDVVVYGAKNRLGRDLIVSIVEQADGTILVLEEVRTGKRLLALDSARKYPATRNATSVARTVSLNARSDGGDGLIIVARK